MTLFGFKVTQLFHFADVEVYSGALCDEKGDCLHHQSKGHMTIIPLVNYSQKGIGQAPKRRAGELYFVVTIVYSSRSLCVDIPNCLLSPQSCLDAEQLFEGSLHLSLRGYNCFIHQRKLN